MQLDYLPASVLWFIERYLCVPVDVVADVDDADQDDADQDDTSSSPFRTLGPFLVSIQRTPRRRHAQFIGKALSIKWPRFASCSFTERRVSVPMPSRTPYPFHPVSLPIRDDRTAVILRGPALSCLLDVDGDVTVVSTDPMVRSLVEPARYQVPLAFVTGAYSPDPTTPGVYVCVLNGRLVWYDVISCAMGGECSMGVYLSTQYSPMCLSRDGTIMVAVETDGRGEYSVFMGVRRSLVDDAPVSCTFQATGPSDMLWAATDTLLLWLCGGTLSLHDVTQNIFGQDTFIEAVYPPSLGLPIAFTNAWFLLDRKVLCVCGEGRLALGRLSGTTVTLLDIYDLRFLRGIRCSLPLGGLGFLTNYMHDKEYMLSHQHTVPMNCTRQSHEVWIPGSSGDTLVISTHDDRLSIRFVSGYLVAVQAPVPDPAYRIVLQQMLRSQERSYARKLALTQPQST